MRASAAHLLPVALLLAAAPVQPPAAPAGFTPERLAAIWDAEHVSPSVPALLTHGDVTARLRALASAGQGALTIERAGESVEGRALHLVQAGRGPLRVLLWSQMHGDEPTATAALLDLFEFLQRHRSDPPVARLLSALTLYALPMLNPDGAERYERRNAQGIDINRDALRLVTPEGRTLKAVRDRLEPHVGFNLHNQNWRTTVGDPPRPASLSLLAVAFDEARSGSEGRTLTSRICAVIREAVEPFAPGQIGRYDDAFEPRAFGDNITRWGTPVVLIETGPWPGATPDPPLVRLNFVALVSALDALASGRVHAADPSRYESLPLNGARGFHTVVRNALVDRGAGMPRFTADIGIGAVRSVAHPGGRRTLRQALVIEDLGDLHTAGALRTIDATGLVAVAMPNPRPEPGAIVRLRNPRRRRAAIAVGEPAALALLRPTSRPGRFEVVLLLD